LKLNAALALRCGENWLDLAGAVFPFKNQRVPQQEREPFSIVLTPVTSELKSGAEIYVKVRVTNTSQRDIMGGGVFNANGLDMGFHYDCRDAAGRSVEKEIMLVGSVHEPPILKPGESWDEEPPISRACDLSQPGLYEIQVSRIVPFDAKKRVVKSNTIKITVMP